MSAQPESELERRTRMITTAQVHSAELAVLVLYDNARQRLGFDYGSGQRHAEISRKRRELDSLVSSCHTNGYAVDVALSSTYEQIRAACARIERQRLGRIKSAHDRRAYTSKSAMLAAQAWQHVRREIALMQIGTN